ncbi:MAG: PKD domain-containing protein, partial [Opitutaceae bacterium]|nr:PKD domain-containing protein [Opitutaceae bacterium]
MKTQTTPPKPTPLARLFFAGACIALSATLGRAADCYVTPEGAGAASGADWANAMPASGLQNAIHALAPGDTLHIGSGTYTPGTTPSSLTIAGDGLPGAPKQIIGVDTGGGMPVFKGAYTPGVSSGGTFLSFPAASASHWNIKNLVIKNHRFPVRMRVTGTTYALRTYITLENIVCDSVEDGFGIYNASRITIKNCTVTRHTKKAFRISDYSQYITLEGCYSDCNGGDDSFPSAAIPTGFCCDDTGGQPIIHDISFIDCVARNNRYKQAGDAYWNGDGFTSEGGAYNLLFLRCQAYDNDDGGFDNKAANVTCRDCISGGNKKGFRQWGVNGLMYNCVAVNNAKRGGTNDSDSIWVSGTSSSRAVGGDLTVHGSTFHNAVNTQVFVQAGAKATLIDSILSTVRPSPGAFTSGSVTLVNTATYRPGAGDDPLYTAAASSWQGYPADGMDSQLYGTEKGYNSTLVNGPANAAPALDITAAPLTGDAPLTVRFTAAAADTDGVIANYAWDFGDGQTSFDQNPSVTFGAPGDHIVICTVTDNRGATTARNLQVTVGAPSTPVALRIEAGSAAALVDAAGRVWAADYGYGAGGGATDRGVIEIDGTDDDRIYQTERWGVSNYTLLLANGTYTVRLHFAETYTGITAAGQRVFSVTANGASPAGWSGIDVFAQAGGVRTALIKEGTVRVTDNTLRLDFAATADNTMISGIEIIPDTAGAGDIPPTAPANLAAANIGCNAFDLSWDAAGDDAGVTAYEVFLNGASHAVLPGTATSATLAGLNQFTTYAVTVRARDASGNTSAAS